METHLKNAARIKGGDDWHRIWGGRNNVSNQQHEHCHGEEIGNDQRDAFTRVRWQIKWQDSQACG